MTDPFRTREHSEHIHSRRQERLEALFREEITFLVESELRDPVLEHVVIHRVTLSHRGARANVWFSSRDQDLELVETAFMRARRFLRFCLSDAIPLKRTPELRFFPEVVEFSRIVDRRTKP